MNVMNEDIAMGTRPNCRTGAPGSLNAPGPTPAMTPWSGPSLRKPRPRERPFTALHNTVPDFTRVPPFAACESVRLLRPCACGCAGLQR
jgi:hypothetical protein